MASNTCITSKINVVSFILWYTYTCSMVPIKTYLAFNPFPFSFVQVIKHFTLYAHYSCLFCRLCTFCWLCTLSYFPLFVFTLLSFLLCFLSLSFLSLFLPFRFLALLFPQSLILASPWPHQLTPTSRFRVVVVFCGFDEASNCPK